MNPGTLKLKNIGKPLNISKKILKQNLFVEIKGNNNVNAANNSRISSNNFNTINTSSIPAKIHHTPASNAQRINSRPSQIPRSSSN